MVCYDVGFGFNVHVIFHVSAPISCVPTPPGPPQFDSGVCNNAVVNVTYLMTWNASVVMSAEVFITVANVTMTDIPTDFSKFRLIPKMTSLAVTWTD